MVLEVWNLVHLVRWDHDSLGSVALYWPTHTCCIRRPPHAYWQGHVCCRTKWKRQTAVGLELLAEAGNYAAFQRLYGGPPYCWPYPGAAPSAADLYYRQAAVAAATAATTLQKPLAYRLYPGVAGPSHLPTAPPPYYHPLPPRSPSPSPPPPPDHRSHSPQSVDVEDESPESPNVDV